jgi:rapamycin-insensitive companion of mTOR
VRRYVFDLFDIDLDGDVLRQLDESAKALALPVSEAAPPQQNSRVSVLFAAPRAHAAESDEEDEAPPLPQHAPVISLRPKSTVVGFTDE